MGYSMRKNKTYNKKKIVIVFFLCVLMLLGLMGRLVYLMVFRSDYYSEKADELHERERDIKAARGKILDANGTVLAANRTVCTMRGSGRMWTKKRVTGSVLTGMPASR